MPSDLKTKLEIASGKVSCACGKRSHGDRVRCVGEPISVVKPVLSFMENDPVVQTLIQCDMECLVCGHVEKFRIIEVGQEDKGVKDA